MNTRTPQQLINSIKRVTDDIRKDKQNFRIEKNLKKITDPKTGKLVKPSKPKPSMTLVAGKIQNVKDAPEELKMEQEAMLKKGLKQLLPQMGGVPKRVQPAKRGGLMKGKKKKAKKTKRAGRLAKRGYGAARK